MLCSYGRLARSFYPWHVRWATTSVTAKPRGRPPKDAVPDETPVKKKRLVKNLGPIEATNLEEIQAALESSSYKGTRKPRKAKIDEESSEAEPQSAVTKRRARSTGASKSTTKASATTAKRVRRTRTAATPKASLVARLLPPHTQKHHDLASFLAHIAKTKKSTASNVYKGTHFEYTVAAALEAYNFNCHRTGRSNDLGIDLVGHWRLPSPNEGTEADEAEEGMPVLIQCKFSRPSPAMIRELEGAYTGAPAGWRGDNVLALLVSTHAATTGVRAAVQRSRWPLGVLQVTREGQVLQWIWNAVAAEVGLEGLGVGLKYAADSKKKKKKIIALTWMGKPWRPVGLEETPLSKPAGIEAGAEVSQDTEPAMEQETALVQTTNRNSVA